MSKIDGCIVYGKTEDCKPTLTRNTIGFKTNLYQTELK